MKYYRDALQKQQQEKYLRWQQQEINRSQEAMQKNMRQISCRTLRHCKNSDSKYCMYCKWNKACLAPQGDYFVPIVPGIKVLP